MWTLSLFVKYSNCCNLINQYFNKQWRSRWKATQSGISSGSALFAKIKTIFRNINILKFRNFHLWPLWSTVVECLTRDRGAASSRLTSVAVLCPWARHIYPCLVLVQPRKTRPNINKKTVDWDVNQTKTYDPISLFCRLLIIFVNSLHPECRAWSVSNRLTLSLITFLK